MNAAKYKATRERLGMTQAALAVALDVSRKAINQREQSGTITREAAMALELLELRKVLNDPARTHAMMLRGSIAWTKEGLLHILGDLKSENVPDEIPTGRGGHG
jgi:DNA-binding XRE family transcriptional regulator